VLFGSPVILGDGLRAPLTCRPLCRYQADSLAVSFPLVAAQRAAVAYSAEARWLG